MKQKKPVLFYWYTPQYLNAQYHIVEVQLPKPFKGCKDDAKAGGAVAQYRCAYSTYPLEKVFGSKFAKSGSPAVAVLKKFSWTNDQQNTVATLDRRAAHEARRGRGEVGQGESGPGQQVARQVAAT